MAAGIPALTGLRFVAAGTVFAAHALPKIVPLPQNQVESALYTLVASLSGQGMTLFFVLSGFVIHYNYVSKSKVRARAASSISLLRGLLGFILCICSV